MNKNWKVLAKHTKDIPIVDQIISARGVEDKEGFLSNKSISNYFDDFDIEFKKSLKKAKKLIEECISEERQIVVFGDYDSDGINATAILYNTIKKELKFPKIDFFIPNRFDHGYGFSVEALDEIFKKYKDKKILLISVDSGITAVKEVDYLKEKGHELIITDHHQKPDVLPKADVIVWNDQVVGAAISWMLSKVLGSKNEQNLGLAAIGTVTDLYPLVGFNRAVVKKGLEIINKNPPKGLSKLLELSGFIGAEIGTYELGWVVGPRLNASGRLMDATESLQLFIEEDEQKIEEIAFKLTKTNSERQEKTIEMFDIASDFDKENLPKVLFSVSEDYHEGIIGLVASKLVQKYYRPAIVISLNGDEGKGSVRSIDGVNIIEYLREFEDLFINLGGHPMAAGFTIEAKKIDILKKKMLKIANQKIPDNLLTEKLLIDLEIPMDIVSIDLLNQIDFLKPFGLGNPLPVFCTNKLTVADVSTIGKDKNHLRFKFFDGKNYYKGVMFNADESYFSLKLGDIVKVAYTLKSNNYNGKTYVDLFVKDLVLIE